MEIERKWSARVRTSLDKTLDFVNPRCIKSVAIDQFYLLIEDDSEIRARRAADPFPTYYITKKLGKGKSRFEVEYTINEGVYNILKSMIVGHRISKHRRSIKIGGHVAELDFYLSPESMKNNIIIEIEFKTEEESNKFDDVLIREYFSDVLTDIVEKTDDPRYKNKNIALSGGAY